MTLNQLETLSEDELALCLYVCNITFSLEAPKIELNARELTWLRHDMLVKKMIDAFPRIKPDGHAIYLSLMEKLGVKGEIRQQSPPVTLPVTTLVSVTSSISEPSQETLNKPTGSNNVDSGSAIV